MANTIWDIQVAIHGGATCHGNHPGSPYAAQGQDYWQLWKNTQRESNRRAHAVNHCREMARRAASVQQPALALDWAIAAVSLSETDSILGDSLASLLGLVNCANLTEYDSWADALNSQTAIDRRLLAVSILRAVAAAPTEIPFSCYGTFMNYIRRHLPDICKTIALNEGQNRYEEVSALKSLATRLEERLRPVRDAIDAHDLHILCKHHNSVLRSLNDGTASAMLTPYLPRGFISSQVPLIFSLLDQLRDAPTSELLGVMASCRAVFEKAAGELDSIGTLAARDLLLPLICAARRVAIDHVNRSDATKPASLTVAAYQKKYPFSQSGANCRLRFLLRNQGPGPAMDVSASFLFFEDVTPDETRYELHVLEKGNAIIDIPVSIGDVSGAVEYHVALKWKDYNDGVKSSEVEGVLESQPAGLDWEALSHAPFYSLEAVTEGRKFIGRKGDLSKLVRDVVSRDMGSAFIYGQKRVGKTSLANEVARLAKVQGGDSLTHIYLDSYVRPTAAGTIQALGSTVCKSPPQQNLWVSFGSGRAPRL